MCAAWLRQKQCRREDTWRTAGPLVIRTRALLFRCLTIQICTYSGSCLFSPAFRGRGLLARQILPRHKLRFAHPCPSLLFRHPSMMLKAATFTRLTVASPRKQRISCRSSRLTVKMVNVEQVELARQELKKLIAEKHCNPILIRCELACAAALAISARWPLNHVLISAAISAHCRLGWHDSGTFSKASSCAVRPASERDMPCTWPCPPHCAPRRLLLLIESSVMRYFRHSRELHCACGAGVVGGPSRMRPPLCPPPLPQSSHSTQLAWC